jgi:uncharacterized protein (UPF0262 family)
LVPFPGTQGGDNMDLTFQQIHTAFKIFPQQTQAVRCRGLLPEHPRRKVTREYILALEKYYRERKKPISPEADKIIRSAKGSGDE